MALSAQQRELVRQIGTGTPGNWAVFRNERKGCPDSLFGRPASMTQTWYVNHLAQCYVCRKSEAKKEEIRAKIKANPRFIPY